MRRLYLLTPCVIALLAVAVIGCGDDDSPTSPPPVSQTEWHVPTDAPTIAAAADSAQQGEAIVLAPGTYLEYGIVLDVGVDLRGESGKAGDVVIDGQGLGRVLLVELDEETVVQPGDTTTVLENLVITGGAADVDGGGGLLTTLRTELRDVRFVRNTAAGPGGAMRANSCDVELHSCEFDSNTITAVSHHGGGLAVFSEGANEVQADSCGFERNTGTGSGGGAYVFLATMRLTDCWFFYNTSSGTDLRGGGLEYVHTGTPESTLDGCVFAENTADHMGGGVACLSPVAFTDCQFSANTARRGGALALFQNSTVTHCQFHDNTAVYVGGDDFSGLGGAIHMTPTGAVVADCFFGGNHGRYGAAIFSTGEATLRDSYFEGNVNTASGAVYWVGDTSVTVRDCNFAWNSGSAGGAFGLDGGVEAGFHHCLIDTNTAAVGGAFQVGLATVRLDSCTVTRNTSLGYGGAFAVENTGPGSMTMLYLNDSIVSGNDSGDVGGAIALFPYSAVEADNVEFSGNTAAHLGDAVMTTNDTWATFTCCDIQPEDVDGVGVVEYITEGCVKREGAR